MPRYLSGSRPISIAAKYPHGFTKTPMPTACHQVAFFFSVYMHLGNFLNTGKIFIKYYSIAFSTLPGIAGGLAL
jgi:hypothetical protein